MAKRSLISNPEDLRTWDPKLKQNDTTTQSTTTVIDEYTGPTFVEGDLVQNSGKFHKGAKGVIFKTLANNNYWVAFPDLKHHYYESMICEMQVFHAKELTKFDNN